MSKTTRRTSRGLGDAAPTGRVHRLTGKCTCRHEDWQHGHAKCAVEHCACVAHWTEAPE